MPLFIFNIIYIVEYYGADDCGYSPLMVDPNAPADNGQPPAAQPATQARNPLHGITLEAMLVALEAHYGWFRLSEQIPIRCFAIDPSVKSSLAFLRKTPWARAKVESLYLFMLREQKRGRR